MNRFLICILIVLAGCASRAAHSPDQIVSIQMLDRNGFSETISNKDRLKTYQKVNFLSAQPYQKVLRVFGRDAEGKSHSKITSYHSNGQPWQCLEAVDGRAHGLYREWHENGQLYLEAHIIEGMADLSEVAQASWLFDGTCKVWDENGSLEADFTYAKGVLQGDAHYFYQEGQLSKLIPYEKGEVHGLFIRFSPQGERIEVINYLHGVREGEAFCNWNQNQSQYLEFYKDGLLIRAQYWTPQGELLAQIENGWGKQALFKEEKLHQLVEYKQGTAEGLVELYNPDGGLWATYHWKDGQKEGEEQEYYPNKNPKLLVNWHEDRIEGVVKTWYENGVLESQREMSGNKKQGLSFAYYKNGDLMLMEEYENDKLIKGNYYPKGEKTAASKIEEGQGIATLYNADGHFMKKISYERGKPLME